MKLTAEIKNHKIVADDKEALNKYLVKNNDKKIKLDITLDRYRSLKHHKLYWSVCGAFGNDIEISNDLSIIAKKTDTLFKALYSKLELKEVPTITEYFGVEIEDNPFSIAFNNMSQDNFNAYTDWVFKFVLEYKNVNREGSDILETIQDYIDEYNEGIK